MKREIMDLSLEELYKKETGAPFIDSLTGLFNHGFFQITLEREIKRSERHGEPFSLAMIDIDSFALYNKRHGSVEGDRILREIAGLTLENTREADLAARYTSDVFAVMLIQSNTEQSFLAAERIRQAVEKLPDKTPTVSIGLASYPGDAKNGETMIKRAQEALLQAKVRGKNRACFLEKQTQPGVDAPPNVLVVDDEPRNIKLLDALLRPLNYEVLKASSGEEALSIVNKFDLDLILLDIMMPGMDGYEVCRRLKRSETTRLIPVIMVTALDDGESKVKAIEAGADDFLTKPPNKTELLARTRSLIKLKRLNSNLASIENVLFSLANTVEAKDTYTQGHVERVSNMAVSVGKKMGMRERELEALRFGGALHDIGKIAVPGRILNKPGPLDPDEWDIMKSHPDEGCKICLPLMKNLGPALEVIRHHHEKLDGSGYPDGLKGDDISLAARVMGVADIYDALVTDRPYRKGMTKEKAFSILREEVEEGKLDKKVVETLIALIQ
jgi:putative two-component system response regulator